MNPYPGTNRVKITTSNENHLDQNYVPKVNNFTVFTKTKLQARMKCAAVAKIVAIEVLAEVEAK